MTLRDNTEGHSVGFSDRVSAALTAATLKILAMENPGVFAGLVAKVLPTAFDDEMPAVVRIITGVPRHGEELPPEYFNRPAQIPGATPELEATSESIGGLHARC